MKRTCEHCGAPVTGKVCTYCHMPIQSQHKKMTGRKSRLWLCIGAIIVVGMIALTAVVFYSRGWIQQLATLRAGLNARQTSESASIYIPEWDTEQNATASTYDLQQKGIYPSGTYLVGTDIPAGEYLLVSSVGDEYRHFYAGVYTAPDCENDSEISGGFYSYSAIVLLEEGTYFEFSWAICYDRTKNNVPNDPFEHPGMFQVGVDIDPGTYVLTPWEDYASYQIYTELGTVAPILSDSNRVESQAEITLEEGEYLYLADCVIAS